MDKVALIKQLSQYFTGRDIVLSQGSLERPLGNYLPPGSPLGRGLTVGDGVKMGVLQVRDGRLSVAQANVQRCPACGGTGYISESRKFLGMFS